MILWHLGELRLCWCLWGRAIGVENGNEKICEGQGPWLGELSVIESLSSGAKRFLKERLERMVPAGNLPSAVLGIMIATNDSLASDDRAVVHWRRAAEKDQAIAPTEPSAADSSVHREVLPGKGDERRERSSRTPSSLEASACSAGPKKEASLASGAGCPRIRPATHQETYLANPDLPLSIWLGSAAHL